MGDVSLDVAAIGKPPELVQRVIRGFQQDLGVLRGQDVIELALDKEDGWCYYVSRFGNHDFIC